MIARPILLSAEGEQASAIFTPSIVVLLAGVSDQELTSIVMIGPMCYRRPMDGERLALVIFLKSLVVSLWAYFEDARPDKELLARFQHEWDRRRAKKPLLLVDRSSETRDFSRTVE